MAQLWLKLGDFPMSLRGQGTLASHASLDSGINEYLVGQKWQCVRHVQCAEMAAGLYALNGFEMAHQRTGPVTRG